MPEFVPPSLSGGTTDRLQFGESLSSTSRATSPLTAGTARGTPSMHLTETDLDLGAADELPLGQEGRGGKGGNMRASSPPVLPPARE